MSARDRIGFMQGRLSPPVNGRIQAFPAEHWEAEFAIAGAHGFKLMEWTIDHDGFAANPLVTASGQARIRALSARHGVAVRSVTADSFMQAPFHRLEGDAAERALEELGRLVAASVELGLDFVVVPLVDNGRVDGAEHARRLEAGMARLEHLVSGGFTRIVFESDFAPAALARFIASYPARSFGINYDIGNSASLGFDPEEEFAAYAGRIDNVHVKDRLLGGTTADLKRVFGLLAKAGYRGNFVLQTARAADGDDVGQLLGYRAMVEAWIAGAG
jgi:hexulose-6-phosphate isomerase